MVEERKDTGQDQAAGKTDPAAGVDVGRRAALKNIGALAGAAPAVAVLLAPSTSRAQSAGGSPCEGMFGCGPAPGDPTDTGAPGGNAGFLGKRES